MSTLYDDTAESVIPMVETFRYHDTLGPHAGSDMPAIFAGEPVQVASANKASRGTPEETSRLIAEARAEGVAQGALQAATRFEEELALQRKRVADLVLDFRVQSAEYYSKVEIEVVQLSLAIAAKILHRESQVDRMVVAGLVKVMLERFQQNTKVVVRVRPEDSEGWTHYFRDHSNLQIVEDPTLEPKACLLETELGVANLALDAQLKEVEQGFFDLLALRPDPKSPDPKKPEPK
jgi:flagellar biosynthesis/type III secretory pathway protein FliH